MYKQRKKEMLRRYNNSILEGCFAKIGMSVLGEVVVTVSLGFLLKKKARSAVGKVFYYGLLNEIMFIISKIREIMQSK